MKTELGIEGTTSTKTKPYGEAIVIGITDGIAEKATSENFTTSGTKAFIAVRDALKTALGTDDSGTKADRLKFAGEALTTASTVRLHPTRSARLHLLWQRLLQTP